MLFELKVTNFRSIAELQTFSMLPSIGAGQIHRTDSSFYPEVMKVGAIYGPNGAGKSNLIHALQYLQDVIRTNSQQTSADDLPYDPFLFDNRLHGKPTEIEITFSHERKTWRYGLSVLADRVHSEWLYARGFAPRSYERLFFRREAETNTIEVGPAVARFKRVLVEQTNKNQLFLVKLDQNNCEASRGAFDWLTLFLRPVGNMEEFTRAVTADRCKDDDDRKFVVDFLRATSVRVANIEVQEEQKEGLQGMAPDDLFSFTKGLRRPIIRFVPNKITRYDVSFLQEDRHGEIINVDFDDESSGTQNLFALAGPLLETLRYGYTLVVDELNQSFHTQALGYIVDLFHSAEANVTGAQLIFTSHDVSIMDMLERDEIWFAEKDADGASTYFSASEFGTTREGGARRKQAFGKRYLEGRYGALPDVDLISTIQSLMERRNSRENVTH